MDKKVSDKPAYSFIEVLEMVDGIKDYPHLTVMMDVLSMDKHYYTPTEQVSMGKKLKQRFIEFQNGYQRE